MKIIKKREKKLEFSSKPSKCPFCFTDDFVAPFKDAAKTKNQPETWHVWCLSDDCIPGSDHWGPERESFFGFGNSRDEAVADWNQKCQEIFRRRKEENEKHS